MTVASRGHVTRVTARRPPSRRCCAESIDAARAAHPDKNLGVLPRFPM
ncbi:hypothetical protein [Sorangium sp. So ce854]